MRLYLFILSYTSQSIGSGFYFNLDFSEGKAKRKGEKRILRNYDGKGIVNGMLRQGFM